MGRTRSRPSRVAILEVDTYESSLANENVAVFDAYSLLVGEKELIQPEYSKDLLYLNAAGMKH